MTEFRFSYKFYEHFFCDNLKSIENDFKNYILPMIQTKIVYILKFWIENQIQDFKNDLDDNTGGLLLSFIDISMKDSMPKAASILKRTLLKRITLTKEIFPSSKDVYDVAAPISAACFASSFLMLSTSGLAKEISLIEAEIVAAIPTSEILFQSGNGGVNYDHYDENTSSPSSFLKSTAHVPISHNRSRKSSTSAYCAHISKFIARFNHVLF